MKKGSFLVIILLLVSVGLGWKTYYDNTVGVENELVELRAQAEKLESKELYFDAINVYKEINEKYPSYNNLTKIGDLNRALTINSEAEKYYLEAIDTNPKERYAYDRLTEIYEKFDEEKLIPLLYRMKDNVEDFDSTKLELLELKYFDAFGFGHDDFKMNDGKQVFKENKLYGLKDSSREIILEAKYEKMYSYSKDTELIPVVKDKKAYFIDVDGYKRNVADIEYEEYGPQFEKFCFAKKEGIYKYLDYDLNPVNDMEFEDASSFNKGLAAVKKNNKWGIINNKFEEVVDYIYDEIMLDSDKVFNEFGVSFAKKGNTWYLLDEEMKVISEDEILEAEPFVSNEPAAVKLKNGWNYITKDGKILSDKRYAKTNSFMMNKSFVKLGDKKWTIINQQMREGDPLEADDISSIDINGFAKVKLKDKIKLKKVYGKVE